MANIKDLLSRIESGLVSHEEKLAALSQVENTIKEMKQKKQEAIQSNVSIIVDTLKTIQAKVEAQLAEAKAIVPEKGPKGDKGDKGLDGRAGVDGKDGRDGVDGRNGIDGKDGISVRTARVDFDGSLIIVLSDGTEVNAGEVVGELQDRTAVITQLNALLPDQYGNSGKYLTTDGSVLSWGTPGGGGGGSGTVTSVAMTVPTGLTVTGSPVTSSGTLAVTYTAGYSIPMTSSQTNWNTAYGWGNHASAGYLVASNNLSDLANTGTARTNLGLGTAATMSGPSGSIVGTTDTQTLTNKRIDPRVSSTASASSVTPTIASYDIYAFTALAASLTINAPSGSPVDGDKLIFRILDNGSSQTLSWNGTYTAIGVTIPTSTTAGKTTYVGCIYNANNTRWDVVAVTTQA